MSTKLLGSVLYWQYQDGWKYQIDCLRKSKERAWEYDPCSVGWFCWTYPSNDDEFKEFMSKLESAEYTFRFNGGDPMYTVFIKDKNDAHAFANAFGLKI